MKTRQTNKQQYNSNYFLRAMTITLSLNRNPFKRPKDILCHFHLGNLGMPPLSENVNIGLANPDSFMTAILIMEILS